ncbi:hypothetical protein V6N13_117328 [Hibiscus sabdariffa]
MAFIGEAAVSMLLELLLGKSINAALNFVAGYGQVGDQLNKWKSKLHDINAVLNDAEEKQIKHEGVKKWLEDLQVLAYDADDILDEFVYEELRLKLRKTEAQASTSKVRKLLPACCIGSDFTPSSFLFKNAMVTKMKKITDRLNDLDERRKSLELCDVLSQAARSEGKKPARLQLTSMMDEAVEYVGRNKEKQEMLDLLKTNNSSGVCVLSIVGMGGMGKTTLAQLVYNDSSVESFDHRALVGESIVRKCDGLPLATKAIGSLLCTKTLNEWERVSEIARDTCFRLEDNKQKTISDHSRHSSYILKLYDTVKKFEPFYQTSSLRTFLPLKQDQVWRCYLTNVVMVELLPKLNYLRVLSLCGYWITEWPEFLENLKHLRYLNLSGTEIQCLPDSLGALYLLETLLLKGCSRLRKFPSNMKNLVNLHYLDIRGANLIEKMPLRIGNLIDLQRLSDFIIGEGDGHRIGELKNLSNLIGDFCLSGLENVNGQDVTEARLNEKLGINMLVLKWSSDFEKHIRKNEVEEQVLDSLRPPKMLEQLVIENFGGEKLSSWIADHSFMNLSSLKLLDCRNYKSLPTIGRLPSLKDILIGGFNEVHKIGVEFFGQDQSIVIASLETLSFESLPKWEEWDACEGNEQVSKFPGLRKLSIRECPQLSGRLPTCLQSLHRLEIKECSRLVVSISSYPSLRELSVEGCEELVDECSSSAVEEVAPLQSVTLSSISKFSIAAERRTLRFANSKDFEIRDFNKLPELLHAFTSLTIMKLERCPSMVSFSEINFLPALKELKISDCDNLQYLFDENASSNTCLLERLEIGDCWSLIQLSSRGDICNQLQHLEIRHCPKLRSLFLNSKLPVMLKKLHIWNCRVLECNSLEYISIWDAGNIKSLPQGLDKLSHLQEIHLWSCSNLVVRLEEIGLPTAKLRDFRISWCENIGALPKCINNFTSLRRLVVGSCSADISFPEEGFPTNLTQLEISDAPKISSSLFDWGFHRLTSLQLLVISGEGCSNVVSFPEERMTLPRSLTYIYITKFDNLEFIRSEGFQHLTSLEELDIGYCPKLKSLPEKDKLLSLGKQIESVIILKLRLHSSSPLEALVNLGLLNEVMFNGNLQSEGAIFLHKGVANSQMSGCERVIISEADVLKVMFTETAGLYELFIKVGCSIVIHWIIIQFGDLGVGGLAKIDQAYYVVLCCLDYRHFM